MRTPCGGFGQSRNRIRRIRAMDGRSPVAGLPGFSRSGLGDESRSFILTWRLACNPMASMPGTSRSRFPVIFRSVRPPDFVEHRGPKLGLAGFNAAGLEIKFF